MAEESKAEPTPHPTREEWAARQAAGPPELAAILAGIQAARDAESAERRRREEEAERAADARATEFREGLAAALAAAGVGFLADYFAGWSPSPWAGDTAAATAEIDAQAIGLHPIRVRVYRQVGPDGAVDFCAGGGSWQVRRPGSRPAWSQHDNLDAAMGRATLYAPTPF